MTLDTHKRQLATWFEGKDFTKDWFSYHAGPWFEHLHPWQDREARILEIGSWEGRSALFFLNYLPKAQLTCVDTFEGSQEHVGPDYEPVLAALERRFLANTAAFAERLQVIKARSAIALDRLTENGDQFDIIYIDASHRRDDVLIDSIMSWRLLAPGGILIWDDLHFRLDAPSSERPADAITAFCSVFAPCFDELHRSYQLIVRKTNQWPRRQTYTKPKRKVKTSASLLLRIARRLGTTPNA